MAHWQNPANWNTAPWYTNRYVVGALAVAVLVLLFGLWRIGRSALVQHRRLVEVHTAERRLATIIGSTDALIYLKDRECRYTYANPKACEFFGKNASEIVGLHNRNFMDDIEAIASIESAERQV